MIYPPPPQHVFRSPIAVCIHFKKHSYKARTYIHHFPFQTYTNRMKLKIEKSSLLSWNGKPIRRIATSFVRLNMFLSNVFTLRIRTNICHFIYCIKNKYKIKNRENIYLSFKMHKNLEFLPLAIVKTKLAPLHINQNIFRLK